jgi:hypothetical protein
MRFKNCVSNQLACSLVALLGIAVSITGCGGGGGSGSTGPAVPPGVPTVDLHSDIPFGATRVFPDGGIMTGAINSPGDVDFFAMNLTEGIGYVVQFEGLTVREPSISTETGLGFRRMAIDMLLQDTVTTLPNSTAATGFYDINPPAGFDDEAGTIRLGDSRVFFVAPATGTYFFALTHGIITGTGNYEFKVASSHFAVMRGRWTVGQRNVFIENTEDEDPANHYDVVNQRVNGQLRVSYFEPTQGILVVSGSTTSVFLLDQDGVPDEDRQSQLLSMHNGQPNTHFDAHLGVVETAPTDMHSSILDVTFARRSEPGVYKESSYVEYMADTGSGKDRHPVKVDSEYEIDDTGNMTFEVRFDFNTGPSRGGENFSASNEAFRTFFGFDWFLDMHFTTDLDLFTIPIVQTLPHGDMYQLFETDFVLNPPGETFIPLVSDRVISNDLPFGSIDVLFDSSLSRFQMQYQHYFDFDLLGSVRTSAPHLYVGQNLAIHAGGPGEIGPKLFDVGIIPGNEQYPHHIFNPPFPLRPTFVDHRPGQQLMIGDELTNEELNLMREAFYGDGFYLQITDFGGSPIVRAEGNTLEIQLDPNDVLQPLGRSGAGTKYTRGTASFVTEHDGGAVMVIANGENLGTITSAINGEPPTCGNGEVGQVVSAKFIPQEYFYKAIAEDGTEWDGFFTIENGGCTTVVLGSSDEN